MQQEPLFDVDSDWVAPAQLPRLGDERKLYLDLETRDPGLTTRGPAWTYGEGEIVGVAIGTEDAEWYFPIRHATGENLPATTVERWLGDLLADPGRTWIAHSAAYEYGWLRPFRPRGRFVCTALTAALVDENRYTYGLDALARALAGTEKDERLLRAAARARGWKTDEEVKGNLWRLPARFVGPYGEGDVVALRALWRALEPKIAEDGLERVWNLEMDLIPLFVELRARGVRVDVEGTERLAAEWKAREAVLQKTLPRGTDVWASASLARLFDSAGIRYPRTALGAPSFTASWLDEVEHPLGRTIVEIRRLSKARSTFLEAGILGSLHRGRIHCEWHQLRSDDGGTVSGRVSSTKPGMQTFPSPEKNPVFGVPIRRLFLPEEGEQWCAADYSQQEPRWAVHLAAILNLPGAAAAVAEYVSGSADFHAVVARLASIPRPKAKIINLGIMYGMGKKKLAESLGLSIEEAEVLLEKHAAGAPFLRELSRQISRLAGSRGYVRTYLGRRSRFEEWEPREQGGPYVKAKPKAEAEAAWGVGKIRRAYTHKAMNRVIQGSSADQTKLAMLELWRSEGLAPLVQMHDELDYSTNGETRTARIVDVMTNVVQLRVPSVVDVGLGETWGDAA